MDSKKFLLAMNELDDRMILKAERYGARRVAWVQFWDEAGAWAASIAALAVMLLLILGLNYTGLLRDSAPLSAPAAESRESSFALASSVQLSSDSNITAPESAAASAVDSSQSLVFSDKPFLEQTNDIALPEDGWTSELYWPHLVSIFGGTDAFIWSGVNMTELFGSKPSNPYGTVTFDKEQNVYRMKIRASDPFHMDLDLTPDALPPSCAPNDFQPNQVIFGAGVDARKIDLGDGTVRYEVRFVREGGENRETIGVRAAFENKRGTPSAEEIEYYVNLFVQQALDPEQTLQLSQLSMNYPKEPPHGVIAKDGTITYDDIYTQQVYELCMHTEETSQTIAPPYEGQRVKIVVPDLYFAMGCTRGCRARQLLFVLLEEEYLVYEQNGTWYVALNNAYCDLAGFREKTVGIPPKSALDDYDFWLPSDGSQYFPSILEFCESIVWGTQNAQEIAEGAIEHSSARRGQMSETARQLLEDYLAENGITEYEFLS